MNQIVLCLEGYKLGTFSFDVLGGAKHERALSKALARFEKLMGEDCIDEFHKHISIKKGKKGVK